MNSKILRVAVSASLFSLPAFAGNPSQDAAAFRQLLIQEVREVKPDADAKWVNQLSYVPDAAIQRALAAGTVEEMMEEAKAGRLRTLMDASLGSTVGVAPVDTLAGQRLTIVIVPGVFAEFIKNRAFEDVLEKPSADREAFKKMVKDGFDKHDPNAMDRSVLVHDFDPALGEASPGKDFLLSDLISMGELHPHGTKVRVILFGTPFSSGESLGDNKSRAEIMIRRLDKYLALTGKDQKLAFVGYSRGTPLGLEILAQAKAAGKPWVANVKGMISLSGVTLGSTLADDATLNPDSPTKHLLEIFQSTGISLEKLKDGQTGGFFSGRDVKNGNIAKWAKAIKDAAPWLVKMNPEHPLDAVKQQAAVDPRAPIGIFLAMYKELGLDSVEKDYNQNIDRFNRFIGQLLTATKELSTAQRVEWFKTHELPKNVTYYAFPAAMANPDDKEEPGEASLYANPLAYGVGADGAHSQDDIMLVQNRKDYTKGSNVPLNDSQVSVIQAAFPAQVIERLNPANVGIKTKFLGIAGTHHWGQALREVNKMKKGQVNGFPREAVLRALAIQVLLDEK